VCCFPFKKNKTFFIKRTGIDAFFQWTLNSLVFLNMILLAVEAGIFLFFLKKSLNSHDPRIKLSKSKILDVFRVYEII
jgi:hypothetical protein